MPRLDPFADLIDPQSQPSDPFADLIAPSAPAAPSRPSTVPTQSRYEALSRLETPQARTSDLVLTGRGSMPDDRTVEEQRVIESAPVYNPPSLPRPAAPLPKHDPMVDPETVAEYERAKAMHAKQGYPLNNDPDAGLLDDLRTWLVGGTMQGVKGAVGVADTFRAVTDALPAPLAALGGIVPQPGMPQPGEVVRDTVSFNDIEQGLNAGQSAGTQAEQKRFSEAKGIIEKAGVALTSPRLIAKSIVESIPLMVGGAWAGKALVGSTPLAAAIGEGAGMMGVDAETMAESNDDGRLQPKQAMLAAAIGTLGAAIGRYSSALAGKLGVADADMLLVGAAQNPQIKRALARNIAVGMVQEGVFEELPQGLVETALTNIATGKPITEGMADDAILGTITGAAMGSGAQVLSAPAQAEAARQAKAEEDRRAENTQRFNAANDAYFQRFTPEGRATSLEQWRAEQQKNAAPPATQDDVTATFARMMARQTENRAEIPVETALIGQTIDQPIGQTPEVSDSAFTDLPVAGDTVDGRTVLDEIPNQDSIDSSLTDYEVLPGVREVPMSAFDPAYKVKPYSVSESDRLDRLQNDIARSNTIAPLIVVVDKERYPYILEGGHRFDALKRLGATSFPALVVLDRESLGDTAAATGQSAAAPAPMASFDDLIAPEPLSEIASTREQMSAASTPPADVSMESENIDTPKATRVSDDEARAALTDEDRVADAPAGAGRDWPMILGHARAQGYTGSPEALARAKREIEGFDASRREETDGSDNGIELLKAIRDVGGLKDDGGGEFSTLWEASTGFVPQSKTKAGDRYKRSKNYATGGVLGVGNVLVKYGKGGKTWDGVRESLSELPAFRRFADMSATDLMNEVMEVVGTRTAQGQGRENRARGVDYTAPGWWQDRINNAGYTPVEQEASDYLGTFTPEDRRELYEALRDDEDQADAMGVQAEIFKRLEQEYAGGNVAGTDQAALAEGGAYDRTVEPGSGRAGQASAQGDRTPAQTDVALPGFERVRSQALGAVDQKIARVSAQAPEDGFALSAERADGRTLTEREQLEDAGQRSIFDAPERNTPRPVSVDTLAEDFGLKKPSAQATMALVEAMGLDPQRILTTKGGEPGSGSLEQSAYHGSPHIEALRAASEFFADGSVDALERLGATSNVPSANNERLTDVQRESAKQLTDLLVSDSTVVESLGESNVVRRSRVLPMVRGLLKNRKVLNAVVRLVPVDVVNVLSGGQTTPKMLLDNPSVLVDLLPSDLDDSVPGGVQAVNDLASSVALAATEVQSGLRLVGILSSERDSAGSTSEFSHASKITQPYDSRPTTKRQRSGGTVRASVEFMQSGEALIRALENPNASSAIHEIAHIARRWLMNRDVPAEQRRGITDQDIAIAETWAGVSDGKWTTKAEEKFARGFERYLRDGVSPTPRLSKIFKAFSQWLTEIYRTVTGSEIDVDISPAMREVFDRLVTRSERLAAGETQAKTAMVHGSPTRLDTLQPGSMFSNDPVWAAGYTTKLDAVGDGESFVGSVHGLDIPEGKTLTARSVHAAEGLVIDMATDILGRQPSSLKEAAEAVARDTGAVAVVAKNANGDATGGILLVSAPVTGYTDPKKALASARDEGREIPANLSQALERTKPGGPPRTKSAPVPEDIRTLGMDEDTAPEFGAALDVPADVRSSLETAEKAALDRLKKKRESGGVLYQADRKRTPKRSAAGTMRPFVEALGHGDLDSLISDGMYETFQSSFQLSDDGLELREESTLNNGRDRAAGRTKAAPLSMFTNWLESPQADEAVAALDKKLYPGETPYAERLATAREVLKKVGAQSSGVLYQSDAAEALPFDDHNDLLVIGAAKMARGITDFAKWSQAMTADLGDSIAPGLRDLYTASRNRAVLLSKFDPNDYFNFKRSALTGDTLEALKASVIDTVLATGRIPKEKETWDEIRVDAEYYGPEIVKYLAPFQQQQAQFRVVRYAAKQRIDALKAEIYRDWQKIDRQRREGVLDPVAYAVEERKIDAKERDVRELLNVWMRMRSEDGRNLAMHRIIAERTWDDYEFWTRRAKKAMGLPPTVDLPTEVEKRINEIIQGGKIKIAERKARAPREAAPKPSGPPTSKPRVRTFTPKTPAQSKMLAAVEKMKAAMAAKAQAELGNVLYQADTVKTVDADLVQYAREFIEAAREDGTTDPEAAWSAFADIFGESYDGLRDAFEEAARDVFDSPDVVIPKVARGKRRTRLDDLRALGREDDGSPEFADPNAGKPSRRDMRERQDVAGAAFGDTTPLEGMVEDDGTVEYADPNTPAPKAVKPSKADVQTREDAASGAFGQDIEDEVKRDLAKMLMELDQSGFGETAMALRKAGLLTGPKTAARNIGGNSAFQVLEEVARVPSSLVDMALSLYSKQRTVQGMSPVAFAKATREAATKGISDAAAIMKGERSIDDFLKTGERRELNSGYPWLDAYANTVFRFLSAQDAVFKSYAFRRSMEEQASLMAKARGVTPAELLLQPTEAMLVRATADAEFATFNNPNAVAKAWNSGMATLRRHGAGSVANALEFIVPFTNTPSNIIARLFDYMGVSAAVSSVTPSAWKALIKDGLTPEHQRVISQAVGRGMTGSALVYMGWMLAAAGLATGGGEDDDRGDRNLATAAGRLPGAILVGDRWHTISAFSPVGMLITVGASLHRRHVKPEANKAGLTTEAFRTGSQVMLDQPMLSGMQDTLNFFRREGQERYLASQAGSFIPTIVSDAASLFDPYRRETRADGFLPSLWAGMASRLPGARNYLPERVDVLGRTQDQIKSNAVNPLLSTPAKELSDPVIKALLDADVGVTFPVRKQGESDTDYNARVEKTGQMIEKMVKATVSSPSFARLPLDTRTKMLKAAIDRAKDAVPAPRPPR